MAFGMLLDEEYEPNSMPNLSLSRLPPCKLRGPPIQMMTPPLHPSLSIPFQWEEAPGKPRPTVSGPAAPPPAASPNLTKKAARRLNPRTLLNDDPQITKITSPTTVLDGPYVGRSLSLACTFSFRKGPVKAREEKLRPKKKSKGGNFGSWGFGSSREGVGELDSGGNFDFSATLGDFFKSEENVMGRIGRKRSFFRLSSLSSNLWGDIYASFKQAIPWKRRR